MKAYRYFFSLLLVTISLPTLGQDTLQLADVIQTGLEQSFNIRIARNNQRAAENNHTIGNAGFLPTLGVTGAIDRQLQNTRQFTFDGEVREANDALSTNIVAQASANWVIFDGTQMFINYQQLGEIKNAQAINTRIAMENRIAEISTAFYNIILQKAQQGVFQENLDVSKARMDIAEARYKIGNASKLEFLTAQVDYNADQALLIQQREMIYNAKVRLNNLINVDPATDFEVPDTIDPNLLLNKEELRESVNGNNPNLLLVRRSQNIAFLEKQRARTDYLPVISLNAGYNYNFFETDANIAFALRRNANGLLYGISTTWNLFEGFNRQREVQNLQIDIENTQLRTDSLTQSLLADLESRFMNYSNSIQLMELEQLNVDVAKENTQIALERYRLGNTNNLELREVQRNAVQAQSRLINAVYAIKVAEVELMRLSGKIMQQQS